MVFAPDEGLEAVLRLEMSSDVEITGYEEPPPSPERVDLTRVVRSRQQSLLEFARTIQNTNTSPILGFHTFL